MLPFRVFLGSCGFSQTLGTNEGGALMREVLTHENSLFRYPLTPTGRRQPPSGASRSSCAAAAAAGGTCEAA